MKSSGVGERPSSGRCFVCFRPLADCFCAAVPTIDNRTPVLIVQHRRESFHRFNSARIVRRALVNCQLLVDHTPKLVERLETRPGDGLLFPGAGSRRLDETPLDELPRRLVVVDGTWSQATKLVRELGPLHRLPRFGLAPERPGRFRIRQEPGDWALSTLEAVIAALRVFEPETAGFDRLEAAFDLMVERQLARTPPRDGA